MIIISVLPTAKFEPNDRQENASHFMIWLIQIILDMILNLKRNSRK